MKPVLGHRIRFKWIEWNREKVASHGISPAEAEQVLQSNPEVTIGHSGAFVARGQTTLGRYLEVVFVWDEPGEHVAAVHEYDDEVVFVITAYYMTRTRKKGYRRRRRP